MQTGTAQEAEYHLKFCCEMANSSRHGPCMKCHSQILFAAVVGKEVPDGKTE